jgi:hypothetical protein
VGVFLQFSTLGAIFLAIYVGITDVIVFCLLWGLFIVASLFLIILFIRNLGRSEELLEDMILQLECQFGGVLAGICLTGTIMDVLFGHAWRIQAW